MDDIRANLADLGLSLRLIGLRVQQAIQRTGLEDLLGPALDEVAHADKQRERVIDQVKQLT